MGRSHRPHRRGGRRDESSPESGERVLVLPGDQVAGAGWKPGRGTYRVGDRIFASVLGLYQPRPPLAQVVPLNGRYIPKEGDEVIGTVVDVQGTFWLLNIGAPRWAPLHMTGTPWSIEIGETQNYLRVGDAVLVRVESLEATGRIGVTMLGDGLGKLEGGTIITVSPAKIPRVIGRGASMIQTITRLTGARVAVGRNGRIWIDGTPEAIQRVAESLRLIDDEGHRPGLTERVESYLAATASSADLLMRSAPRSLVDAAPEREGPEPDGPGPDEL
ncbi:MAG: exosome complex protein Rrp4 [Thermoplasmata archaeon]|jgi:exosome complex component RRP4